MLDNLNMYEILGIQHDPIYCKLQVLKDNEELKLGKHVIRKTDKFYEIENDFLHEGFAELDHCYRFLSALLMKK
ncbi:hypothetical protein [Lysinibacillus sp. 54212]|uniref:hypothetical protein n=1 Tax=Lysinibacillus sp. 54212 TaxID=3119829 RepID=UPI002FCA7DF7